MKVLVTGGTGVVGVGAVTALARRGHDVRLLSRHAEHDARRWPEGVEPWPGDVADAESIRGAADGCDVVLHLVAVVDESPPEATFDRVNVRGTRNIVREAERAGVRKLVFVSSLGCDRGSSAYHQSKRAGEKIVRSFDGDWVIVRPGSVYGPGDPRPRWRGRHVPADLARGPRGGARPRRGARRPRARGARHRRSRSHIAE